MINKNPTSKEQEEINMKIDASVPITIGYFETIIEPRLDKKFDEKLDSRFKKQNEWLEVRFKEQDERFEINLKEQGERFEAKLKGQAEASDQRLERYIGALMEDNRRQFQQVIEGFDMKFESFLRYMDGNEQDKEKIHSRLDKLESKVLLA